MYFLGIEASALDAELVDRRLGVRQAAEIDPNGSAARRRLRAGSKAQIIDGFAGFGQIGDQPVAVGMRLDSFQLAPAERAGDVAPDQLAQGFEFEYFGGGFQAITYIFAGCGSLFL